MAPTGKPLTRFQRLRRLFSRVLFSLFHFPFATLLSRDFSKPPHANEQLTWIEQRYIRLRYSLFVEWLILSLSKSVWYLRGGVSGKHHTTDNSFLILCTPRSGEWKRERQERQRNSCVLRVDVCMDI